MSIHSSVSVLVFLFIYLSSNSCRLLESGVENAVCSLMWKNYEFFILHTMIKVYISHLIVFESKREIISIMGE